MKYQVLFSQKNNEKVFVNVVCGILHCLAFSQQYQATTASVDDFKF